MTTKTPNNSHIYSLVTQARGKFVMAANDPNNRDPIRRAKIEALYGKGNILVVSVSDFLQLAGNPDLLKKYSIEGFSPLTTVTDNSQTIPTDVGGANVTLYPPSNISLIGTGKYHVLNNEAVVDQDISFYASPSSSNAADYEVIFISPTTTLVFPVSNFTATKSANGIISFSFDTLSDAINYIVTAADSTTGKAVSEVLVNPAGGATSATGVITVPTGKTYTVYATAYNAYGLAGNPSSTINVGA
jgi:hypothetical protein